jgi:hypothetical protein
VNPLTRFERFELTQLGKGGERETEVPLKLVTVTGFEESCPVL